MLNTTSNIPLPPNEPVYPYAPGTAPRAALQQALTALGNANTEIPLIIGGREVRTGRTKPVIEPHAHGHVLGHYHLAGPREIEQAIAAARAARHDWERLPFQARAAVFLKAAELLSQKYRYHLNAATMLNQSKNPFQAEIDSACELIDFWRFNPYYAQEIFKGQPDHSPVGTLNFVEYRALEGFVFAVTPFNFTSIAGNLPTAPALMGNVALWKPASTAVLSGYVIMQILMEAGLPPGVINFVPCSAGESAGTVFGSPDFAGIHFTGSTEVFQDIWRTVGAHLPTYKSYPRLVGETGGKDFIFAHESADLAALATALVRGAFEYQGQKCSAVSRAYVPDTLWPQLRERMGDMLASMKTGPVQDFSNFCNAVIDRSSFEKCRGYVEHAKKSPDAEVVFGGECDDRTGFFVTPAVILARAPRYRSMCEEIFGPILTVHVYASGRLDEALELCNTTSPFALTGAVFAQDRQIIHRCYEHLRHTAGNFYINDKPTGAVVGQQPFGGARGSGTNDKAGSPLNLTRWVNVRTVKENFCPPVNFRYPFME